MSRLDEIVGSGPPAGGSTPVQEDDLNFLGMPRGYVATRPGRTPASPRQADRPVSFTQITPPKYQVGAEMEPRGWSPENIARLQQQLVGAGLIGGRYRLGVWDSTSISAYKGLLSYANQGGLDRETALAELAVSPEVKDGQIVGAEGGGFTDPVLDIAQRQRQTALGFDTALNTYERSDPASVRVTAEEAFRKALGRKPRKAELDRFVNTFMVREKSAQGEVFEARDELIGQTRGRAMEAATLQPVSSGGSESDELWNRLQLMIRDAPGKITPGPRSRDLATQKRLYARWKAGKGPRAARPGTSKHGDGRANDLTYENDAVRAWALANAGKYGLAFPIYDPRLSRRMDESWHVELAGSRGSSYGPAAESGAPPPISQNVTAQRQDLGAQALEFARSVNPVETRAYDIGQQFNSFLSIIQRGIGL
jgi:hypothetical protein